MVLEAARARGLVSIPGEFDYAVWRCSDIAEPCREVLQSYTGPHAPKYIFGDIEQRLLPQVLQRLKESLTAFREKA
eukprot:13589037-Alexandrium_andersonii.AAC.1